MNYSWHEMLIRVPAWIWRAGSIKILFFRREGVEDQIDEEDDDEVEVLQDVVVEEMELNEANVMLGIP